MRRTLLFLLAVGLSLIFLSAAWLFRPYEKADPDLVISELRDLEEPFQAVHTAYYLDGGSIGIWIIDNEGTELKMCLPAPLGEEDPYKRLFIGQLHYSEEGAREIMNSRDTILRVQEILRKNKNLNKFADIALAHSSGRLSDYLRIIRRAHITRVYPDPAENSGFPN